MTTAILDSPEQLQSVFDDVADSFGEVRYSPFLKRELVNLESLHAVYFAATTSPAGEAWAPLAPSTIKRKGHSQILRDTGRLIKSLATKSADSVRDVVDEGANRSGLAFGTSVPYSIFHDKATAKRPARRHVGFSDNYLQGATERAATHTIEGLKNASV
jgi:phage gpG-like protein